MFQLLNFSDASGDTILTMIQSLVRFSAIFRLPWSIRLEGHHARTFPRGARGGKGIIFIEVWIMIPLGCVKKRCVQLARCWREHVSLLVIGDGWGMIRCYFSVQAAATHILEFAYDVDMEAESE